jgi:hypothetical protein
VTNSSNKSPGHKKEEPEMETQTLAEQLIDLLRVYLALFLSLTAFGFLFAFIINWEDWFFGIKLDGWLAGIFLFSKAVVALVLTYILIMGKQKKVLTGVAAILFLAFVFILPVFSSQRNMRSELGWTIFWIECVIFLLIPSILLIIYFIVSRNKPGVPRNS